MEELLKTNPEARIAVSQPRRLATESISKYVAGKIKSGIVGFHHRNRENITPDTRITYTVERSLLNSLIRDPMLLEYDAVILDEIHERSIDLDLILPLLKSAQQARSASGKKLKIVLTSANPDIEKLTNYFKDGCKHIEVKGRAFPVKEIYSDTDTDPAKAVANAAKKAQEIIAEPQNETGDILIFMPGKYEIDQTIEEIKKAVGERDDLLYIPLLGGDQKDESAGIYENTPGKRKIIVSTNVAETSITIDTVKTVIDSGLMRTNVFDEDSGITELRTIEHTQSNALQRKGRAGRVAEGKIYYLFSKKQLEERPPQIRPEILRTNLTSQVLMMKGMGIQDIYSFDFIDHPGKEKINQALSSLFILGAIDKEGKITDIGKQIMEEEADPHFARMLIEAKKRNCEEAVELLIGLMSERSSIYSGERRPFTISDSDFHTHLAVWNEYIKNDTDEETRNKWAEKFGVNTKTLHFAFKTARDLFHGKLRKNKDIDLSDRAKEAISICMASGLIDRHLVRDASGSYTLEGTGRKNILIDNRSVLARKSPPDFFSANLRYVENSGKTFAKFNLLADEKLIREAAPYLFKDMPAVTPEKAQETRKPEPLPTPLEKAPAPVPTVTPIERPPVQKIPPKEKNIVKKFFLKIKEIAHKLRTSISTVWEKFKNLFRRNPPKFIPSHS